MKEVAAMKRVLSCALLLALIQSVSAQTLPAIPPEPADRAVRATIDKLKAGKLVTLTLASGEKVKGSVIAKTEESLQLRVRRGVFRYREETYPVAEIVSVKTHLPAWVGPVVGLGIAGGIIIGVVACVASGACLS
jgi:hypothetical protein